MQKYNKFEKQELLNIRIIRIFAGFSIALNLITPFLFFDKLFLVMVMQLLCIIPTLVGLSTSVNTQKVGVLPISFLRISEYLVLVLWLKSISLTMFTIYCVVDLIYILLLMLDAQVHVITKHKPGDL